MSSAALAQRRHDERDAVQPEVEVLRGSGPCVDLGLEVAVGRGDDAHVDRVGVRLDPTRAHLALLEHAQELRLDRERQLADLVEEHGAAVGRLEAGPACARSAPVNAPFSWPKSSLSSSVLRERARS